MGLCCKQPPWQHCVIRPQSHKKISLRCEHCPDGYLHQWVANVQSRTQGSGCPQCTGHKVCRHNSLATKAPTVAADWDYRANAGLGTPDSVVSKCNRAASWLCHDCGHSWTATINSRVHRQTCCPKCELRSRGYTRRPTFAGSQHPYLAQWDHKRNAAQGNFPENTTEGSSKQVYWLCPNCPARQEHSWSTSPVSRTSK